MPLFVCLIFAFKSDSFCFLWILLMFTFNRWYFVFSHCYLIISCVIALLIGQYRRALSHYGLCYRLTYRAISALSHKTSEIVTYYTMRKYSICFYLSDICNLFTNCNLFHKMVCDRICKVDLLELRSKIKIKLARYIKSKTINMLLNFRGRGSLMVFWSFLSKMGKMSFAVFFQSTHPCLRSCKIWCCSVNIRYRPV